MLTWLCAVTIDASKDGVRFSCTGDIGNGSVTLRSNSNTEKPELGVEIDLTEPVALTFSLKYLINFCEAQNLSKQVKVQLSNEVPLLVEYELASKSYLRFYLAPKVRSPCAKRCDPPILTCDRLAMRSKAAKSGVCKEVCTTGVGWVLPRFGTSGRLVILLSGSFCSLVKMETKMVCQRSMVDGRAKRREALNDNEELLSITCAT